MRLAAAALPWAPGVVPFAARVMDDPRAKSEAVALLCTVRQHAGSDGAVFARLGDLKPALHTALEAEFAKVASTARAAADARCTAAAGPRRCIVVVVGCVEGTTGGSGGCARSGAAREVAVVAGAERADISASITAALLEQLGAAKWSDRDEAMSRVSAILSGEGGNCITSNIRELPIALAARLTDSNKNLRVRACALVGQLGAALGPEGEAAAAHLLPPMLTLLGDNRKAMRDAVCAALDSWYDALGLPAMAPYLAAPLATDSSIVRRTLLAWLDQRTAGQELPQCPSLAQAVPALMSAAEDRTADVRQLASSALQLCIAVGVPYDAISHAIDELRPASRVALQPLLDTLAECANVAVPSSRSAAASGAHTRSYDSQSGVSRRQRGAQAERAAIAFRANRRRRQR
jgi:cytoskeleton-associated protein 5